MVKLYFDYKILLYLYYISMYIKIAIIRVLIIDVLNNTKDGSVKLRIIFSIFLFYIINKKEAYVM